MVIKRRNNNKSNLTVFYIAVLCFIILVFFIFYFLSDSSQPNIQRKKKSNNKRNEDRVKIIDEKQYLNEINMLDLFHTKQYGYPNSYQAYIMCYINSALQLLRTAFSTLDVNNDLPNEIQTLLNSFITYMRTSRYTNEILKLIVPDNLTREQSFYNNRRILRQSDSYEFLYFLFDYIFSTHPNSKKYFKFDEIQELKGDKGAKIIMEEDYILRLQPYILGNNINTINVNEFVQYYINGIVEEISDYNDIDNFYKETEESILTKTLTYVNFSEYLLLNIVLFNYNITTNRTEKLLFYTILDNLKFETYEFEYEYMPVSVICHNGGSPFSGHYINYSKRPKTEDGSLEDGEWWLYNDNHTTLIGESLEQVNNDILRVKSQPYIILFKQNSKVKLIGEIIE